MTAGSESRSRVVQSYADQTRVMRYYVNRTLEGEISPEQAARSVGESKANIFWTIGHITFGILGILPRYLGRSPQYPEDYLEKYGVGSQPSPRVEDYPPLAEMIADFNRACDGMVALIESLTEEDLQRPLPEGMALTGALPNVGALIHYANMHSTYHAGQISLRRRAQGLPTGFGR